VFSDVANTTSYHLAILINVREYRQSRETGNIGYKKTEEKQSKNTTQYVLDTIMSKQKQLTQIRNKQTL
jgi:hypothetical protein